MIDCMSFPQAYSSVLAPRIEEKSAADMPATLAPTTTTS
jgi:hypothetical protein